MFSRIEGTLFIMNERADAALHIMMFHGMKQEKDILIFNFKS